MTTTILVGFALTYALHSTLLLGSAWAVDRWLAQDEPWRETIWKAALVGAIVTSAVAMVGPGRFSRQIDIDGLWASRSPSVSPVRGVGPSTEADTPFVALGPPRAAPLVVRPAPSPSAVAFSDGQARAIVVDRTARPKSAPAAVDPSATSETLSAIWATGGRWFVYGWIGIAAVLLFVLAVRHVRLDRLLRDRQDVDDDMLLATLTRLRRQAGVWRPIRLTHTPTIGTPDGDRFDGDLRTGALLDGADAVYTARRARSRTGAPRPARPGVAAARVGDRTDLLFSATESTGSAAASRVGGVSGGRVGRTTDGRPSRPRKVFGRGGKLGSAVVRSSVGQERRYRRRRLPAHGSSQTVAAG